MTVQTSLQSLELSGALTRTGLVLAEPQMPYEQYEALGALLGIAHQSMQWAIGDWLLFGEAVYGEESYQASEVLGLSPEGRTQYRRVAEAFPPRRRRHELSWSHHRTVAPLEPEDQDRWLQTAVENAWSNRELGEHVRVELGPATRGRGAKRNPEARQPEPPYVVEAVDEAAREVVMRAERLADAAFRVPADALQGLAGALGLDLPGEVRVAAAVS